MLLHVNNALVLWFASIGYLSIGIQVDGVQDGQVLPADVAAFVTVSLVLAVWLAGTARCGGGRVSPSPRVRGCARADAI